MEKKTEKTDGKLQVPETPVIPFIEGDGIGRDILLPSQKVIDAAVAKTYGGNREVTADLYPQKEGATRLSTTAFAEEIIKNMH